MKKIAEIEALKTIIDEYAANILVNEKAGAAKLLPELAAELEKVILLVISYYDKPEMSALKEDRNYWTGQLGRILGAVEQQDGFLIYDSLVNELVANLDLFVTQATQATQAGAL